MTLDSHAFREAFIANEQAGFALVYVGAFARAPSRGVSFVAQKGSDEKLWIFVFERPEAAESERAHFSPKEHMAVQKVTAAEVRAFTITGYLGIPARAFLRNDQGEFAEF